jgi:hypothetical protein
MKMEMRKICQQMRHSLSNVILNIIAGKNVYVAAVKLMPKIQALNSTTAA